MTCLPLPFYFHLQGLSGAPGSPGDTGVIGHGVGRTTSIAGL